MSSLPQYLASVAFERFGAEPFRLHSLYDATAKDWPFQATTETNRRASIRAGLQSACSKAAQFHGSHNFFINISDGLWRLTKPTVKRFTKNPWMKYSTGW